MADLGGSGLFVAIISMIFAVEISRLVIKSGFTIKMPEQVPSSVARSFESLIPNFSYYHFMVRSCDIKYRFK